MLSQPVASRARRLLARARAAVAGSPWTPLAGKAAGALAGFALLALVGSGAMAGWMPRASGKEQPAPCVLSAAQPAAVGPSAAPAAGLAAPAAPDHEPTEVVPAEADADGGAARAALDSDPEYDAGAGADPDAGGSAGLTADGKIRLNLATEEDLRHLPGIGPAKAKAILALRARLGRLKRPEDLLRVKGIGRRRLIHLRPLLVFDP